MIGIALAIAPIPLATVPAVVSAVPAVDVEAALVPLGGVPVQPLVVAIFA